LLELGCYEISLGDTVGRGNPEKTQKLFSELSSLPQRKIAAHFHDTFDNAI
jgi:hydroxymethylglutaryl-CoA lyase